MRSSLLLLILLTSAGCQTTVGNYFANRGRDLGDCFPIQAGLGLGLGVDAKVAGLLHADAMLSFYNTGSSVGWVWN